MENNEGYIEFVTSESYKHQIDIWYRAYNINHEKINLFYDFVSSLYELVNSTYLGTDFIKSDADRKNHFVWCWNKTIENFSHEKIYFKETGSHFDYFWNFFDEAYYIVVLNGDTIRIPEYFYKLFNFKHKKSRSELDLLTEIYKQLELNLKK